MDLYSEKQQASKALTCDMCYTRVHIFLHATKTIDLGGWLDRDKFTALGVEPRYGHPSEY